MLAELLSLMESQGMEHSQVRSGWQNSVPRGYWIKVPTSLLALVWGLFSTSRGWLHAFAGGLLPPSSKLATVKSRRVESFSRLSLSDRMPLFCLFLPHTLGMEEVTLVVITQIAWTRYLLLLTQAPRPLQTCFWQSPKGHVTRVHELKTDSSVSSSAFQGLCDDIGPTQ